MSDRQPESLGSSKFKNLAIDTNFIKQNANEYNDKISKFYTGGKKESTTIHSVISRSESVTVTDASGQRVEPKLSSQSTTYNPQAQMDVSKQELEKFVDKKIYDLAVKMQQYADQTDATIAQLQKKIADLEKKIATSVSPQQTMTQHIQPTQSHGSTSSHASSSQPSAQPNARTGSMTSSDVAIEKMFNFSNNASGRRN
jgi:ribosome-associated translation inhibitor RaiA